MKTNFFLFAFAILFTGMLTSCSIDDEPLTEKKQLAQTSDSTDPIPEHEGEDEELETNN